MQVKVCKETAAISKPLRENGMVICIMALIRGLFKGYSPRPPTHPPDSAGGQAVGGRAGQFLLTLKSELCTSKQSSNGLPLWKGICIFLSSGPQDPFCLVLQTTYPPSSNRGLKWKAMSLPLRPVCKFTENLGQGKEIRWCFVAWFLAKG